jgi:hypothetical protein
MQGCKPRSRTATGRSSAPKPWPPPPRPKLVEIIDARIDAFAAKYRAIYPAAVKILLTTGKG